MKTSYLKYITALLLFGSNGIVASFIDLSSYEIVLFRTLIGSILLITVFFLTKEKPTFHKHKKHFASLSVSGIAMGSSWLFLYEAYNQIGVTLASLAYYCGSVIVIILSPILFKEKLTKTKIISFFAVLIGILFVNGTAFNTGKNTWGIFCGLMAAVCYAFMVIFNKKAKNIIGLEKSTIQLFISFVTVAIFVLIKQGYNPHIPHSSIIPILILGIVNTGLGCYLYFSSIGKLSVQTVAICGYSEPLSAVVFSVLILKEILSPIQIIGAVFIIGGAICGELKSNS